MKLPINRNPNVKAYAHHAYLDAVVSAEEYVGDRKAEIVVERYDTYSWEYELQRLRLETKGNTIGFYSSKYETQNEGMIWRRCGVNDEIIIRIDYFQYADADAVINLFFAGDAPVASIHENHNIIRLLNMRKMGLGFSVDGEYVGGIKKKFSGYGYWLKLSRRHNTVSAAYSEHNGSWTEIYRTEVSWGKGMKYLGLNVNFGRVQYYDWLYTNYFQIFGTIEHPMIHLDYFLVGEKNGSFHYLNQLLDFRFDDTRYLKELRLGIQEYCIAMLNANYYVAVYLDEYYVKNRNANQKRHFIHQNMLYGYEGGKFYMMGYGRNNILDFSTISEDELYLAYTERARKEVIKLIRYNPNSRTYHFDTEVFARGLQEFLDGSNSSMHYANMVPALESNYGIRNYELYLKDTAYGKLFLGDTRLSYLIFEHKVLMIRRIEFLKERRLISEEAAKYAQAIAVGTKEMAEECKNLVIKYKFVKDKRQVEAEVMNRLVDIREQDRTLCTYLSNEMKVRN